MKQKHVTEYFEVDGQPAVQTKVYGPGNKLIISASSSVARRANRKVISKAQYDGLIAEYTERKAE